MTGSPPMNYQSTRDLCGPTMNAATRRARAAIQILRLVQVCARTGLCWSIIYQLEAKQRFPVSKSAFGQWDGSKRRCRSG